MRSNNQKLAIVLMHSMCFSIDEPVVLWYIAFWNVTVLRLHIECYSVYINSVFFIIALVGSVSFRSYLIYEWNVSGKISRERTFDQSPIAD